MFFLNNYCINKLFLQTKILENSKKYDGKVVWSDSDLDLSITKIDAKSIPDFDILLGGFPCQAFSIIGKREGFANETCGTLFFDIERILREKKPKAFMLENVRNLTAHDNGNTFKIITNHLEALGYKVFSKVLNALDYGIK